MTTDQPYVKVLSPAADLTTIGKLISRSTITLKNFGEKNEHFIRSMFSHWDLIIDTALPSPDDYSESEAAPTVGEDSYQVEARSSVVLLAR